MGCICKTRWCAIICHSSVFVLLKRVFWLGSKWKSAPCFPGSRSLNLLCVLSAPQHSVATFRVLPRLSCVFVYVTVVLQHETAKLFIFTTRYSAQKKKLILKNPWFIIISSFNLSITGLWNLAHYFVPAVLSFPTHTIHSCFAPRCDEAQPACCSCKLPPRLRVGLKHEFMFPYRAHIKFKGCNEHSNHRK